MIQECKRKKIAAKIAKPCLTTRPDRFSEMLHDDDKRHENKSGWTKNL
jgi:hypothetical protein